MKEQDRKKKFEDLIRQEADGFELKPSDNVWANIKLALIEEQRRRRFVWLRAAVIALLIGSGVTGWLLLGDQNVSTGSTETAEEVDSKQNNITQPQDEKESLVEKNVAEPVTSSSSSAALSDGNENLNSEKRQSFQEEKNQEPISEVKTKDSSSDNIPSSNYTLVQDAIQSAVEEEHEIKEESTRENEMAFLKNDLQSNLIPLNSFDAGDNNSNTLSMKTTDAVIRVRPHRFSLEAEVIPMVSYRTLTNTSSSAPDDLSFQGHSDSLVQQMNQYNKPLMSFSAGINANYRAWKKWNVGLGVHFTRCGERVGMEESIAWTADSGATTAGAGSNAMPEFTPGNDVYINYHHDWIDVDARIGYVVLGDEKNELSVLGGTGISILVPAKPQWQSSSSSSNTASQSSSEGLYKDVAMTLHAGLNYKRKLSSHFDLSTGLQAHYYLTQIFNENESSFSEHPYWGGINLGFAYRF